VSKPGWAPLRSAAPSQTIPRFGRWASYGRKPPANFKKQEEKLIPTLQAEGHEVMASQYGLETLKGDVNATIHTFGRVSGPIVLVGHLRRMRRSM
jgi:hypothetical protein